MATEKRYLTDQESMEELVALMPEQDQRLHADFRYRSMEPCFPGRRLVIYTLRRGEPTDIELVHFGELAVGVKATPTAKYVYRGGEHLVTPTPAKVRGQEVFLSLPQNFVFRFAGQEVNGTLEFRAHYAVLIKTRSRDALEVEGHTYCVTLKRFLDRYPHKSEEVRY